MPRVFGFTIGY